MDINYRNYNRLGDDYLRRSDIEAQSRVQAGAVHSLYGYLSWIAKQVFPDTAEVDYLERWCAIWGVTRKTSVAATGVVVYIFR